MGEWTAAASRASGQVTTVLPTGREDWFFIPETWVRARDLLRVPGVVVEPKSGRFQAHRSLLAILPEAAGLFDKKPASRPDEIGSWKLRDYQKVARDFITSRHGTLLADTMRMGKTFAVCASHDPKEGPMVVAGPLQSRDSVWMTWFQRLWPERKAVALVGRTYDRTEIDNADLIFVHYDVLPAWQSIVRRKPALFVLDEAHVLSNRKTDRTQVAKLIATTAGRTVAVTGTPLWNRPAGLFNILACVVPGAFGGFKEFSERYCDGHPGSHGWVADGTSNVEEFKARLAEIMIRRTWHDVRAELPAVDRNVIPVDISDAQVRRIDLLSEQIRQNSKSTKRVEIGELARYRRLTGKLKIDAAVELARKIMSSGDSVVVWTWHKDVARQIAEKIEPTTLQIDGDTPSAKREGIIARWKSEVHTALVLTMGIGQSAIDLSHARQCIFVEVDFTPAVVAQAEMRTYSPDKPMVVHYLYVDHPVDRRLIEALVTKCGKAQELGTPAADSAIDVLREAFGISEGSTDLNALRAALEASSS
jgi:SNF2 family DNA or RNA helicase